jgi:hypothetical protein
VQVLAHDGTRAERVICYERKPSKASGTFVDEQAVCDRLNS